MTIRRMSARKPPPRLNDSPPKRLLVRWTKASQSTFATVAPIGGRRRHSVCGAAPSTGVARAICRRPGNCVPRSPRRSTLAITGCSAARLYAMGRSQDSRWLPTILVELESEDPEIRFEAARAAGLLGSADALPVLLEAARDDDAEVRHTAISAISQIGGRGAVRALERLAEDAGEADLELIESAIDEVEPCSSRFSLRPVTGAVASENRRLPAGQRSGGMGCGGSRLRWPSAAIVALGQHSREIRLARGAGRGPAPAELHSPRCCSGQSRGQHRLHPAGPAWPLDDPTRSASSGLESTSGARRRSAERSSSSRIGSCPSDHV